MRNRSKHHTRNTSISTSKQYETHRVAIVKPQQNSTGHDISDESTFFSPYMSSDIQRPTRNNIDCDLDGHTQETYYDTEDINHRSTDWEMMNSVNMMADSLGYFQSYPVVVDNNIGVVGSVTPATVGSIQQNYTPSSIQDTTNEQFVNGIQPCPILTSANYFYTSTMNSDGTQTFSYPQQVANYNINNGRNPRNRDQRYFHPDMFYAHHNSYPQNNKENLMLPRTPGNNSWKPSITTPLGSNNSNSNKNYDKQIPIHSLTSVDILQFESKLKSNESKGSFNHNTFYNMHLSKANSKSNIESIDNNSHSPKKSTTSAAVGHSNDYDHQSLSTNTINNIIDQSLKKPDVSSDVVIGDAKDNKTNALINLSAEFAHSQDYTHRKGLLSSTTSNFNSAVGMNDKPNSKPNINCFNQNNISAISTSSSSAASVTSSVIPILSSNINSNISKGIKSEVHTEYFVPRMNVDEVSSTSTKLPVDTLNRTPPSEQTPAIVDVANSTKTKDENSRSIPMVRELSSRTNDNSNVVEKLVQQSSLLSSSLNSSPSKVLSIPKDSKDYKNVESIVNKILVPITYSSYNDIIDMDNQFYKLNLDNINENYYQHHHHHQQQQQQQTTNNFYHNPSAINDFSSSPHKTSNIAPYSKSNYSLATPMANATVINASASGNSSTMGVATTTTSPTGTSSNISIPTTPLMNNTSGSSLRSIANSNNNSGNSLTNSYSSQPPTSSPNQYIGAQRKLKYTITGGVTPIPPSHQHHPMITPPQMIHVQSPQSSVGNANCGVIGPNSGMSAPGGVVVINQQQAQPPASQQPQPNSTYVPPPAGLISPMNPSSCFVVGNSIVTGGGGGVTDIKHSHSLPPQILDKVVVNKLEAFRNNIASFSNMTLKDIQGWIVDFSRDQHGSRFIQQKMEKSVNGIDRDIVFKEIVSSDTILYTLMTDVFGNYVVQKMLEYGNDQQKRVISNHLKGRVLVLTTQMYGCRVIQKAIECIPKDIQTDLIHELDGHVLECVKDQNGNHVIQKCIEHVPANNLDFIINEFNGRVYELSSHPYGCRVIQRLMEHCAANQTQSLMLEIFDNLPSLVKDQYGNYVIQHILDHKKHFDFPSRIVHYVFDNIFTLSAHKFASNVVEKCVQFSTNAQKEELIKFILRNSDGGCSDNLYMMMKDPFANYVVQKIVDSVSGDIRKQLLLKMKPYFINLKKLTYGKHMINKVDRWLKETETMTSFIRCEEEFPSLNSSTRPSG